jgi:hypothetical protein
LLHAPAIIDWPPCERDNYNGGEVFPGAEYSQLGPSANILALAFGLVPPEKQKSVADYVQPRGIACSVYGAQYLLESLFSPGAMKAPSNR